MKEALSERSVGLVVCRGTHSFILSSVITCGIGDGGSGGLGSPDSEIWRPISPKVALVLVRDLNGRKPPIGEITRGKVRGVNEFAERNSRMLAAHSEKLLRSVVVYKQEAGLVDEEAS